MTGDPAAERVRALQARLASLGGIATAATMTPRPAVARPRERTPLERAAELGFTVEESGAGPVCRRKVSVDLGPFLGRAGAIRMPSAADVVRLHHLRPEDGAGGDRRDVAVLDIESVGLRGSGVVPFLVGVGVVRGSRLDVDQLLLADPDAEGALLDAVAALAGRGPVLLTYNGRCFDIPVLMARATLNRRHPEALRPAFHCDLLAPVRRLFRARLGACTLRQAEIHLLGYERVDDVPGDEAPARYRAWLRGAPPGVLAGVVRHNELDLCCTAVLAARLCAHVDGDPVQPFQPADRYHLALHLERAGEAVAAGGHLLGVLEDGMTPWAARAGARLARTLRREGRDAEAAETWRRAWAAQPSDLASARGLAIALERGGDLDGALDVCLRVEARFEAMRTGWRLGGDRLTLPLARGHAAAPARQTAGLAEEWARRRSRLQRRLAPKPGRRRRVIASTIARAAGPQ